MKQELKEYLSEKWLDKIERINSEKEGLFTFAVQTDVHFADPEDIKTANNLKALSNFVKLDFYANLGDLIRGYAYEGVDTPENMRNCMDILAKRYIENAACPVLITIGNHDANHMWCHKYSDESELITEQEHYSRVMLPLLKYNGDHKMIIEKDATYYYMDFEKANIRVIMLNSTNGKFSEGYSETYMYSQEQVDWFKDEALNTNKQIIIMAHIPLYKECPGSDHDCINKEKIIDAVEDFIAKGGKFISYMYGHTHVQASFTDENGRLHISFRNGGSRAEVVMLDTENRTINTIAVGDSIIDRNFKY